VMPHKVGWLVRGPCANSAGASQPPQPAAGVDFFVSAISRAFCEFPAVRLHRPGWAGPCGFRAPGPQQASAGEARRKVRAGLTKAGRPARRHQNCYETALNARQTSQQTERRRAGNSRPCLRLDSQLEPKPPLDVHFPCVFFFRCQLATWPTNPTKPAIAHPPRTTGIRDIPLR
jgi:hypothetical protein